MSVLRLGISRYILYETRIMGLLGLVKLMKCIIAFPLIRLCGRFHQFIIMRFLALQVHSHLLICLVLTQRVDGSRVPLLSLFAGGKKRARGQTNRMKRR
jgi:hypothetical protein